MVLVVSPAIATSSYEFGAFNTVEIKSDIQLPQRYRHLLKKFLFVVHADSAASFYSRNDRRTHILSRQSGWDAH